MTLSGPDENRVAALRAQFESLPLAGGVLAGVATFVAGYVSLFVLFAATGAVDFGRSVTQILRSVGHVFYNAHNVPTFERQRQTVQQDGDIVGELLRSVWHNSITGWRRVSERLVADGEVVQESTRTTVEGGASSLPSMVYLAVPVVVLAVATGLFTYWRVDVARIASAAEALVASIAVAAAITLGYLLCLLLGTYALAVHGAADGAVLHPARLETLGYGLAYPFVTAAVSAGFVVGLRRNRTTDDG